jgi:two-component system, OmpR family, heavy metal sensor histidine kinase CusS
MKPFGAARGTVYSIERRLSQGIGVQIFLLLMLISVSVYAAAHVLTATKQNDDITKKLATIELIVKEAAAEGGQAQLIRALTLTAPRRPDTRLEVFSDSGPALYSTPQEEPFLLSRYTASRDYTIDLSNQGIGTIKGTFTIDTHLDANLMRNLFWVLLIMPFAGALIGGVGSALYIRRELHPLRLLAKQTKSISPQNLDVRLSLPHRTRELTPLVDQFNSLMDELQRAIIQLESFNADVAHELRTPLAALMGHTEVALSRERSNAELRETIVLSLEQMREVSQMVNDMLFLSGADRGALARRGLPTEIHQIASQVIEFHEFMLEDTGVNALVEGSATAAVDAALLQRALSNLISNATRYAALGSSIVVRITSESSHIRILVENKGEVIAPEVLPKIFNRFFRADTARIDSTSHHGLGLAIVSAIARMHHGQAFASSAVGVTQIGLTVQIA